MYNQLIYFIVVLLLFSIHGEPPKASHFSYTDLFFTAALYCFFVAYCQVAFSRLFKAAIRGAPLAALTQAYYRTQARLSITAIGFLVFYVFALDLGLYLGVIPGFYKFITVSGITGLAIYLVHLAAIWFMGHPVHEAVLGVRTSRLNYIKGHLSFTSVILIPWFLISTVTDLLQFIKMPSFMDSDLGQTLLIACILISFLLFGPRLIVRMWGCKPLPPDSLRTELDSFCKKNNFRIGDFLLWPIFGGEMLTAGVVGILPGLRYILITSGLLRLLEVPELKAVVAHEMGHIRKKHMLIFVLIFILFIVFVSKAGHSLSQVIRLLALSNEAVVRWFLTPGTFAASLDLMLMFVPLILLMVVFLRFVFGFFLRNSERQADLFAMQLIGNPASLISSFEKIAYRSGRIEDLPSWHHYSIRERIQFLTEAFHNRDLIRKHDRKLYFSVLLYVAVILSLLFINAKAAQSHFARNWRTQVQLGILEQGIVRDPGNAEIQAAYGGLLFEGGKYSEAESVLRGALSHNPRNAIILNNLAWLYATAPPPHRNPDEALELAIEAVEISREPHILDTLAEAYYINGRYEEALQAINEALARGGPQLNYFLKQKDKFQEALMNAQHPRISG